MLKDLDIKKENLISFTKEKGNYICSKKMIDIANNFLCFVGEKIEHSPEIYSTCHNSIRFCWSHSNGDYLWVELWNDGDCKLTKSLIGFEKTEEFLYSYSCILSEILEFEGE